MTRIVILRRNSAALSSPSDQSRSSTSVPEPSTSSALSPGQQRTSTEQVVPKLESDSLFEEMKEETVVEDCDDLGRKGHAKNSAELSPGSLNKDHHKGEKVEDGKKPLNDDDMCSEDLVDSLSGLTEVVVDYDPIIKGLIQESIFSSHPHPPPQTFSSRGYSLKGAEFDNAEQIGSSRRTVGQLGVSSRSSPTGSWSSSAMDEGYNSADEQGPCITSFYDKDAENRFEIDLALKEGLQLKMMIGDGNCLFRAVADQVFDDSEQYKLVRQMSIDYIEANRDRFSNFITEDFTAYCKRKRKDKVYGNNAEIQALSEIFNRPIHIYTYSSGLVNRVDILHSSFKTDMPPIRLSYHHGNHYNSLVNPDQPTISPGVGLESLQAKSAYKDQIEAAVKAQQDRLDDIALFRAIISGVHRDLDTESPELEIERVVKAHHDQLIDSALVPEERRAELEIERMLLIKDARAKASRAKKAQQDQLIDNALVPEVRRPELQIERTSMRAPRAMKAQKGQLIDNALREVQRNELEAERMLMEAPRAQDQPIDDALLAEVRRDSDLEHTEMEIERMVMEASRAEYIDGENRNSSTSLAEASSSAADGTCGSDSKKEGSALQKVLSMGFNYVQVVEALSIFGDDVDSMVGYLLEKSSKGKAPLV